MEQGNGLANVNGWKAQETVLQTWDIGVRNWNQQETTWGAAPAGRRCLPPKWSDTVSASDWKTYPDVCALAKSLTRENTNNPILKWAKVFQSKIVT